MANNPSIVSKATIDQASGDNPALRAMLLQLANAANTQATKTSTSGKNAPNQSTATVSYQSPFYVVTFTDPGGATASTPTQAAQQAALGSLGSNPVNSVIYHQVQAATSILFDAASNLVTYGGDTGTLQTSLSIGDLTTTRQWYFRIRTSFDGSTWNQWKILNNGNATDANPYAVATYPINGGTFAGITLLGQQVVGFGFGQLPSGGIVGSGDGVVIADTLGIAAPSSYTDIGDETVGLSQNSIDANGVITQIYKEYSGSNSWPGVANYLTFGWVPNQKQQLAEQVTGDGGRWVVLTLAGGTRIAVGCGVCQSGTTIAYPAGFTAANSMGICSPAVVGYAPNPAYGVSQATVTDGLVTVIYADSTGHSWTSTGNWFVIAWEPALNANLVPVAGGQYLKLPTPSGAVSIGIGLTETGDIMPIPPGYNYTDCRAFSTPATFQNILQYAMHGVKLVTIDTGLTTSNGTVYCLYDTVDGPRPGGAAWFSLVW
jgi:hypothetical protein